jgi:hypothetical protein
VGPLQNNTGPTFTRAPLAGSPTIDQGSPAAVANGGNACEAQDQRGIARPRDGNQDGVLRCDIGAVEIAPTAPPAGQLGIANGSLEATGPAWLAPWILRSDLGATITQDSVSKTHGGFSARVNVGTATPATAYKAQLRQENRKLVAGKTYTLQFWARASTARPIEVKLQQAVSPYTAYFTRTVTLTTAWQRVVLVHTATASDGNAFVGFNLAQAAGQVWLDNASLTETNLVTNGSFEATGATWLSPWWFRHDVSATVNQDSSTKTHGSFSARVDLAVADAAASYKVQLRQEGKALATGRIYAIAFWAKASAARSIEVKLQQTDSPYASYCTKAVSLTTSWQQVVLTCTVTASQANAFVGFNLAQTTGQVWIDQVTLTELP